MTYQKINRKLFGALLAAGMMGAVSQAYAAKPAPAPTPGYCSGGTATEGISAGNMTFNSINANDCYGMVAGNISGTGSGGNDGPAELNNMSWGTGWTYFDSTDAKSGAAFMGLQFSVTAVDGSPGTWTLTGTDTNAGAPLNFPTSLDFAVGLKAGSEYALWGFDNALVNSGANSGTFSIVFTNGGGNNPDLSHLIVFGREASGGSIAAIPEPETYAMLLAGLGLVGFAARRKLS